MKAVRFTVHDDSITSEMRDCGLLRQGQTARAAETIDVVARVAATGVASTPKTVRLSTTAITNGTIDHTKYAYTLACTFTEPDALVLYGASVVYAIDSANG